MNNLYIYIENTFTIQFLFAVFKWHKSGQSSLSQFYLQCYSNTMRLNYFCKEIMPVSNTTGIGVIFSEPHPIL